MNDYEIVVSIQAETRAEAVEVASAIVVPVEVLDVEVRELP